MPGSSDLERDLRRIESIHRSTAPVYAEWLAEQRKKKLRKVVSKNASLEWVLAHLGKDDEVKKACEGGEK